MYAQIWWKSCNVRKIMRTKYFIKIGKLWGIIFVVIYFYTIIYHSNSFTLMTIWKTTMTFFLFRKSIEGDKWFITEWTHWMTKIVCVDDEDVLFVFKANQGPRVTYSQMTLLKTKNMCVVLLQFLGLEILWSLFFFVRLYLLCGLFFVNPPKVSSLKEVILIYRWN